MAINYIREMEDMEARRDADKLPTPEEFRELSTVFKAASIGGGAELSREQCQMLSRTFATLSIAIIAVDKS